MRWYNKMYLGKSIQGKKMYYKYAIQQSQNPDPYVNPSNSHFGI